MPLHIGGLVTEPHDCECGRGAIVFRSIDDLEKFRVMFPQDGIGTGLESDLICAADGTGHCSKCGKPFATPDETGLNPDESAYAKWESKILF